MRLSCKLQEIDKQYIYKNVKDIYIREQILEENKFNCINNIIKYFNCSFLSGDGFILLDIEMKLNEPLTDRFEIEGDNIMMEFVTNTADIEGNIDAFDYFNHYHDNTHNLIYTPNYKGNFRIPAQVPVKMLIIILSKDCYFKMIPHNADIHENFSKNILNQNACCLSDTGLPLTTDIQLILNKIKKCKRKGSLKNLYLENSIQELLLLQHEVSKQRYLLRDDNWALNEDDILKLEQARQILEKDFICAPSLPELSKMIYLNEYKLKRGFKTHFGITVKNYIIRLKMGYAIELLKHKNCSITNIANACGYNGLVQFSIAFKKFYGCSPQILQCSICKYEKECGCNNSCIVNGNSLPS